MTNEILNMKIIGIKKCESSVPNRRYVDESRDVKNRRKREIKSKMLCLPEENEFWTQDMYCKECISDI